MNLRHWRNFLKVAQAGSLSRVADEIGVAQPVLSRQIRELEEELGAALFERHGRGMRLTVAGELFRRRADSILGQIALIRDELTAAVDEPSGPLVIGMPPSMTAMLTGRLAASYVRRYPSVRLRIRETTLVALRQALVSNEIELGVITLPLVDPQLVVHPLLEEPMYLVGPATAGLRASVTIDKIAGVPLILPQRPNSIRLIVENMLERAGYHARIIMEADFAPAFEAIADGLGFCVIPSCALSNPALGLRVSSARIQDMTISWGFVQLKDHTPSIAAMAYWKDVISITKSLVEQKKWDAKILAVSDRHAAVGRA